MTEEKEKIIARLYCKKLKHELCEFMLPLIVLMRQRI